MELAGSATFPRGLRVLLVEDSPSRELVETQLQCPDLGYLVTSCSSAADALASSRTGVAAFDVVLAEAKLAAPDEDAGRAFVEAFEDTPVVLMSECADMEAVMRAVKMGAVDFLDKPLSLLKLKNIWQHSVRKMMQRANGGPSSTAAAMSIDAKPSLSGPVTRSGPDSPGTPSAESVPQEPCFSLGSVRQMETEPSCFSVHLPPVAAIRGASLDGCDSAPAPPRAAPSARPPLALRSSTFGPLVALPQPAQWPCLPSGCVWGTPAGGHVMPPLPSAAACAPPAPPQPKALPEPACIKSCPTGLLPQPFSSTELRLPEGFLAADTSGPGPIGLRLKKSDSLLNLINASLTAPHAQHTQFAY